MLISVVVAACPIAGAIGCMKVMADVVGHWLPYQSIRRCKYVPHLPGRSACQRLWRAGSVCEGVGGVGGLGGLGGLGSVGVGGVGDVGSVEGVGGLGGVRRVGRVRGVGRAGCDTQCATLYAGGCRG